MELHLELHLELQKDRHVASSWERLMGMGWAQLLAIVAH